jgi:hypothetical protein
MTTEIVLVSASFARAVFSLTLAAALCSPAIAQPPRGVYVYSWNIAASSVPPAPSPKPCPSNGSSTTGLSPAQELVNSLYCSGVDGLTLVMDWSSIEPQPNIYQWDATSLTPWSNSFTYLRGQAVSHSQEIYLSLLNGTKGTKPADPCTGTCTVPCTPTTCPCTTTTNPPSCPAWLSLGPDPGTSPNLLDQWIAAAAAAHRKVNLAIRSGGGDTGLATPNWLFTLGGSTPLTFNVSAHQGQGKCITEYIAAPWDHFIVPWEAMLSALSGHLKQTAINGVSEYDIVSMIRLTGINRTTDEFRLPEEILSGSCAANAVETWLAAKPQYSYIALTSAWQSILGAFQSYFADKYVNLPIIPDGTGNGQGSGEQQYPFPEIGPGGCIYVPPVVWPASAQPTPPSCAEQPQLLPMCTATGQTSCFDPNLELLQLASQAFPGRLTVEFESLPNVRTRANSYVIDVVQHAPSTPGVNATAAFMTNVFLGSGGASCNGGVGHNPKACKNSDQYFRLLENGIFLPTPAERSFRAQYLEVYAPNVIQFPAAIAQAHADLTDYTPPTVTASITNSTVVSTQKGAIPIVTYQITVSGTMTDDLSGVDTSTAAYTVTGTLGGSRSGAITVQTNGTYSFTVDATQVETSSIPISIEVSVEDNAGNTGSAVTALQ